MSYVMDSNILLRMAQDTHPMHAVATQAATMLIRQGETVHIIPQNLYEFWSVATRKIEDNGLGLSIIEAQTEIAKLKSLFGFVANKPNIRSSMLVDWPNSIITGGYSDQIQSVQMATL